MIRILASLLLSLPALVAEVRTTQEWIEELSGKQIALEGYIATYRYEGEEKSLEADLASDSGSGLGVLDLSATNKGVKFEFRHWNTLDDRQFAWVGPTKELYVMTGTQTEIAKLKDFLNSEQSPEGGPAFNTIWVPSLLLTKDSLDMGLQLAVGGRHVWERFLTDATVEESDDKQVTFVTEEYGHLSISRETGLLLNQSVKGTAGEDRVLELAEFRRNPGREAVAAMSEQWSTEEAKVAASDFDLAPLRLQIFQLMVTLVDGGRMDLDVLGKDLDDRRDALRLIVEGFTDEVEGSLGSTQYWKELLEHIRGQLRESWLATPEGSVPGNEAKFEEVLLSPESRIKAREVLAERTAEIEIGRHVVMAEMLGKTREAELKATTEVGKKAKDLIEAAIFRACAEAVLERKIQEFWGERQGLE